MFAKLLRIKGLGLVFSDFAWPAASPAFKKVNLVYGWNGCGKTTLTRLFDTIARGDAHGVEYEVELSDGTKLRAGDPFAKPVRVFNQPYVEANVRVLETKASAISILLGEENKELLAQVEADQRELSGDPADPEKKGLLSELNGYGQKKTRKEKENDNAFTDVAKTISAATTGSGAASRNYRAPDARKDFAALPGKTPLADAELEAKILSIRQVPLPTLEPLEQPVVTLPDGGTMGALDLAANIYATARSMVSTTVEAEVIERLAANPPVAEWVEQGLHLHSPGAVCEFCGSPVPAERLAQLARHFSDADRALKRELEARITGLRLAYATLDKFQPTDAARLYEELRPDYQAALDTFTAERAALLSQIAALGKLLQEKRLRTTEEMAQDVVLDAAAVREALGRMDAAIRAHNEKSGEFARLQREAVWAIKAHFLSGIFDDVKRREAEIAELVVDLAKRSAAIEEIRARIVANMAQISSDHRACEEINKGLRTFLGRGELRFEPEEDSDQAGRVVGYRIMRGDAPAEYLSEGEKTAVAFVYFVVHLADGKFSKADGVVVIDDPISSLDSNSLYQAFSFLKNAVEGCGQVFILTHNFDFLKLLLNWRSRVSGQTGYYMINNTVVGDVRRASVQHMDRELREYESEYHYLFKRLKEMRADQDGTIAKAYPVPNIARKVWETFLYYRVPNGKNPHTKTTALKEQGYDALKLDAIYKFTNDQSHMTGGGFDPALVPETKKVLDELFEMMELISPEHFNVLNEATK